MILERQVSDVGGKEDVVRLQKIATLLIYDALIHSLYRLDSLDSILHRHLEIQKKRLNWSSQFIRLGENFLDAVDYFLTVNVKFGFLDLVDFLKVDFQSLKVHVLVVCHQDYTFLLRSGISVGIIFEAKFLADLFYR